MAGPHAHDRRQESGRRPRYLAGLRRDRRDLTAHLRGGPTGCGRNPLSTSGRTTPSTRRHRWGRCAHPTTRMIARPAAPSWPSIPPGGLSEAPSVASAQGENDERREETLYDRLGGYDAIAAVADDLLPRLQAIRGSAASGRIVAKTASSARSSSSSTSSARAPADRCTIAAGTCCSATAACASARVTGTFPRSCRRDAGEAPGARARTGRHRRVRPESQARHRRVAGRQTAVAKRVVEAGARGGALPSMSPI